MQAVSRYFLLLAFVAFLLPFSVDIEALFVGSFSETVEIQQVWADPEVTDDSKKTSDPTTTELGDFCTWYNPATWPGGCLIGPVISISGYTLIAAGAVFDFFIAFTLNPVFLEADYITMTWTLMRDLANMAFILGIIAVALIMITGIDQKMPKFEWKNLATRLIVVALLLNFSLFFTQVVIDTGNILGNFFYARLAEGTPPSYLSVDNRLEEAGGSTFADEAVDTSSLKSPSAPIVDSLLIVSNGEQKGILDIAAINEFANEGESQGTLIAINLIIIVLTVTIGWSLFRTGFMFLSRTVVLIILMVVSPLAFVSWFIPGMDKMFTRWFKELISKSFCICAYLFLIYLLLILLQGSSLGASTTFTGTEKGQGIEMMMVFMAVNAGMIFVILGLANKTAKDMCEGDAGLGSKVLGFTTGAAATVGSLGLGAGAIAARGTIGRMGKNIVAGKSTGEPGRLKEMVANLTASESGAKRSMGNLLYDIGNRASNAKFGTSQSYTDKLKKESKERIQRADAVAGFAKPRLQAEVEAEERKNIQKSEIERLRTLDLNDSEEGKKLKAEAQERLANDTEGKYSTVQEAQNKIMEERAEAQANAASLDESRINEEVAHRTRQEAQNMLNRGRGSAFDWALAGGVGAYNEAADSYEVIDKVDNRKKREKAQHIAARGKAAAENQLKLNKMEASSNDLIDAMTDEDQGIVLDESTIEALKDGNSKELAQIKDVLRESLTTTTIDKDGHEQTHFNDKLFDETLANFERDIQGLTRFEGKLVQVNDEYQEAESSYQEVMNNTGSSEAQKTAAQAELNTIDSSVQDLAREQEKYTTIANSELSDDKSKAEAEAELARLKQQAQQLEESRSQHQAVLADTGSTQEEKNRARGTLNVARRAREKVNEQVQGETRKAFGRVSDIAGSSYKAKLETEMAMGTAEQIHASQEGSDLTDQAREGIASQLETEDVQRNPS